MRPAKGQLFGKQREDGLLRACCQLSWVHRLLHLPPGQKLIKSSCDISKRPVACFHSLVFSKSTSVTFFFHPSLPAVLGHVWAEAAGGPSDSPHRTESPHSLPAHAVLEPLRGPPPLSSSVGLHCDHFGSCCLPLGAGPRRFIHFAGADPPDSGPLHLSPTFLHPQRASQVPTGSLRGLTAGLPAAPLYPYPSPLTSPELTTQYPPTCSPLGGCGLFHLALDCDLQMGKRSDVFSSLLLYP